MQVVLPQRAQQQSPVREPWQQVLVWSPVQQSALPLLPERPPLEQTLVQPRSAVFLPTSASAFFHQMPRLAVKRFLR
jgi:hypothetical protein